MDLAFDIKQKIDIVDFLSDYLSLKKNGRNFKAICPFHKEKSPSFIVSPERQIWHCFGACNEGGDIFSFLKKKENMDFKDSLAFLAKRTGIDLSLYKFDTEGYTLRQKLLEINHLACEFYYFILTGHRAGQIGLDYLKERNIRPETINLFKMGFAPNQNDALFQFLVHKKGYQTQDLEAAGLVIRDKRRYFDRFRNRIIFALNDHLGNTLGFSGRILKSDEKMAKYINSPETLLYHKSSLLFGLDVTKEAIKDEKQAIIMEGEMDMLASFQMGVSNVVAIKGSALTSDQLNLLKRFTPKIVLAFDSDKAGTEASRRGIETAENMDFEVKIADFAPYKDPDDCIKDNVAVFKSAIKNAAIFFDFLIADSLKRFGNETAQSKKKVASEILPYVSQINNLVAQDYYLRKIARLLDISTESLLTEMGKIKTKSRRADLPDFQSKKANSLPRYELLEEYLLSLVLQGSLVVHLKIVQDRLNLEDLKTTRIRQIFERLWQILPTSTNDFLNNLSAELKAVAEKAFLYDLSRLDKDEWEKELGKIVREIKIFSLKEKLRKITEQLTQAEDEKLTEKLNSEFKVVSSELKVI